MLKHEARKQVQDRAVTRYPKSVVTVLAKIIDLTRVDDWKLDHVENFFSTPTTVGKIAFLTNLERRTVSRALRVLKQDGVIRANCEATDSYSVNPETLKTFASKYLTTRYRSLEQRILNAVRMKLTRRGFPEKTLTPEWASIHPVQCACLPLFCSHPSTI
jgi:DNA-binding transcriptional ArsR family regulator